MHRILLFDGTPFAVTSFGFMVGLGLILGAWMNDRRRGLAGLDRAGAQDVTIYAIIGGVLGARLLFILLAWPHFAAHPLDVLNLREGGISWYGALAGGWLGIWAYCKRHTGTPIAGCLDMFAPGLLLAHAVGRVGCLLNGCCYGRVTDLPWAVSPCLAPHPYNLMPRHPVQIYESLMDVAALAILLALEKRFNLRGGKAFAAFLGLYAMVRFVAEFFRAPEGSDILLAGLTLAQIASLLIASGALLAASRAPVSSG